jgi:hypothetical protein
MYQSFSKFRQFKLWSVENDVFEDTNVIKHLTKLAQASEEYTAKLELNTAEGEAYKAIAFFKINYCLIYSILI